MDIKSREVGGFVFPSYKEAQVAIREQQNVELIRSRTPFSNPQAVYDLYGKLIERGIFKTMIGYSFLYELRYRLVTEYHFSEEELPCIELPQKMEYAKVDMWNQDLMRDKVERLQTTKKKMTIVIAALVFVVVAMFVIAIINPNAMYVNTENKVLNKYSAWEEDLQSREQAVKEKEKQLQDSE